jgi:hypothetical protein
MDQLSDPLADVLTVEREYSTHIPDDPGETRDPTTDGFIDEVSAQVLEDEAKKAHAEEGDVDFVEIFGQLSPGQRAALLATDALGRIGRMSIRSARWIDMKAVPKHLHLRWISPDLVHAGLGMRGYQPVRKTATTQTWVPNARQYGPHRVFVSGKSILCAIPMREYLARRAAEQQSVQQEVFEDLNEHVRAAVATVHKKLGISRKQAEKIGRDTDGLSMVRGPDPAGPGDRVTAEGVEEELALQKKGRRKSRVKRG